MGVIVKFIKMEKYLKGVKIIILFFICLQSCKTNKENSFNNYSFSLEKTIIKYSDSLNKIDSEKLPNFILNYSNNFKLDFNPFYSLHYPNEEDRKKRIYFDILEKVNTHNLKKIKEIYLKEKTNSNLERLIIKNIDYLLR